ncbi:MAG TPA: hypothetical protein VII12_05110 [Thermoanaerobaculia bacterium]|jgi:hypothetical protein
MKIQRVAIALTVINVLILIALLSHAVSATAREEAPVLRGRALEIVDERGRIRAQIAVLPPDGVILRLIDSNGRPAVKIGGSENGSGISLAGDSERRDWNGVQVLARGTGGLVKITNKDGRVVVIKP